MNTTNVISEALKALACFALVLALVLYPPSAPHAGFGLHGEQQAATTSADNPETRHGHLGHAGISGVDENSGSVTDIADGDHGASQCSNGLCISAMLAESHPVFADQLPGGYHMALQAQIASAEPIDFLRPPRHLT